MAAKPPMRIKTKFTLLTLVTVLALVLLFVVVLLTERSLLLEDRKEKVRSLVESVHSTIGHFEALSKEGKMSKEEAQLAAMGAVRAMRYDKSEYFWINDMNGMMLMHPIKAELNGKNMNPLKDPTGKFFFQEFVRVVKEQGGGYVDYYWPKPGFEEPVKKLSYVKGYDSWGWLIGSGIYIDDVDAIFKREVIRFLLWGLFIGGLIGVSLYMVSRSLLRTLGGDPADVVAITERISTGDLSQEINVAAGDNFSLVAHMKDMQGTLRGMIHNVVNDAHTLSSAARQLLHEAEQVAEEARQQSTAATQMASSMHEMATSIDQVSDNTRLASEISTESGKISEQGQQVILGASSEMQQIAQAVQASSSIIEELGQQSDQITSIVNTIKEIADQTNLLALNAAIEAARAGEQGRGFAVVADEVRKLAERTTLSTQEIAGMISGIQSGTRNAVSSMEQGVAQVDKGLELAEEAGRSITRIRDGAGRVNDVIAQITHAIHEQSSTSSLIASSIEEIAQLAGNTSSTLEQTAAAARRLEQLSVSLQKTVEQFRV